VLAEHTPATLYKILNNDGTACHGGQGRWHLPAGDRPGQWMRRITNPVLCERGYHLCRGEYLLEWLGPALFIAEADGAIVDADTKIVVERARLVTRVETYTERTLRLFACDCADRALSRVDLQDPRSRDAIATARAYAKGEASGAQLAAAGDAAWAAAGTAAWAATWAATGTTAWAATGTAAWAATWAATGTTAWAATGTAAWTTTWAATGTTAWAATGTAAWAAAGTAAKTAAKTAAGDAAWAAAKTATGDAAWVAAWAAAEAAARAAAGDAERAWQTDRLLAYLGGEVA
jgi:hypothetical protein